MRPLRALFGCLALVFFGLIGARCGSVSRTQTEDTVGDVLKSFDDAYKAAAAKHDSTPICGSTTAINCEAMDVHAKHRTTLIAFHRGLDAAWLALEAEKTAAAAPAGSSTAAVVLKSLKPVGADFIDLAVSTGVISQSTGDRLKAVLSVLPNAQRRSGDPVGLITRAEAGSTPAPASHRPTEAAA